jgi:6-phosphogluconolactonase
MNSTIRVHDDVSTLVGDAASHVLSLLESAQHADRIPYVSLTGGSLSPLLLAELARRAPDSDVDFGRVEWWWGDERFVDLDSPERNDLPALQLLLTPLGVPAARIHRVASPREVSDVDGAAQAYADEIRESAGDEWEIVLLGMGPDGHVASLFPHHPSTAVTNAITVAVRNSPKPPDERVSLTFEAMERSRHVVFLVAGEEKAAAVKDALEDGDPIECPARGVRGQESTTWFLDTGSARSLA